MTESNKGRFKCADEGQAVWNMFVLDNKDYPDIIDAFKVGHYKAEELFSEFSNNAHKARLIHGSIYDEHGQIEDKDVAQELVLKSGITKNFWHDEKHTVFGSNLSFLTDSLLIRCEIRGTIFY